MWSLRTLTRHQEDDRQLRLLQQSIHEAQQAASFNVNNVDADLPNTYSPPHQSVAMDANLGLDDYEEAHLQSGTAWPSDDHDVDLQVDLNQALTSDLADHAIGSNFCGLFDL